jgi:hypothetical protein
MKEKMRVLDPEKSALIYYTSYLTALTATYGLYQGHQLAFCPSTVFFTSILYWRDPIAYSWRQYIDLLAVTTATLYSFTMASEEPNRLYFYSFSGIAIIWYPIGYYYHFKEKYWKSTLSHIILHLFANLANLALFLGRLQAVPTGEKLNQVGQH